LVQHGGDEPASGRDLGPDRAGRHAVLVVDQAGWHLSERLVIPSNITIVPLPAKCPELNPQENIWQFLRDDWLSNRVFTSYDNIVDHCCHAWNRLVAGIEPIRAALAGSGTAQGFGLQRHQAFGGKADHLAQHAGVRRLSSSARRAE
jgi:hypothetical protein